MAVSALARLSEDKVIRQAYQKRQDEIMLYNKRISDYKHIVERAEKALAEQETTIADQTKIIAERDLYFPY